MEVIFEIKTTLTAFFQLCQHDPVASKSELVCLFVMLSQPIIMKHIFFKSIVKDIGYLKKKINENFMKPVRDVQYPKSSHICTNNNIVYTSTLE